MEWTELLVGLLGGGIGGTILGRVWDNRREDRFRHVERKLETAADFLNTYWEARHAAYALGEEEAVLLYQTRRELTMKAQQAILVFGHDAMEPAIRITQHTSDLLSAATRGEEPMDGGVPTELVSDFVIAVRRELGVGPSKWDGFIHRVKARIS